MAKHPCEQADDDMPEWGDEERLSNAIFADLISPSRVDEFFADTWQRKPQLFLAKEFLPRFHTHRTPSSECCTHAAWTLLPLGVSPHIHAPTRSPTRCAHEHA